MKVPILVDVDKCISKEIEELNNKHHIVTIGCCCGHKENKGYIMVDQYEDKKMLKLGYKLESATTEIVSSVYHNNSLVFGKYYCRGRLNKFFIRRIFSFFPKSKCKCRRKMK